MRVESGTYTDVYVYGYNSTNSGTNNNVKAVFGSDYDRANVRYNASYGQYEEDNDKLDITGSLRLGDQFDISNQYPATELINLVCKSGKFASDTSEESNTTIAGNMAQAVYASDRNGKLAGIRNVRIEGGNIANLAAGFSNYESPVNIRMTGGRIRGAVYGSGQNANAYGDRRVIITGGRVCGWIAGGCNGTDTEGGKLYGDTYMYLGGNVVIEPRSGYDWTVGSSQGGNVYGAGSGIEDGSTVGQVDNSNIVIADKSLISRNVYGDGNYGYISDAAATNAANLFILGGHVKGNVFGGANQQQGQNVSITMKGGHVDGGIYGGSNAEGFINQDVTIHVDGGQVGTLSTPAAVHGGGYGENTRVLGNVSLNIGDTEAASGATIYGDVYGGSAQGKTNGNSSLTAGKTTAVTMSAGTVSGNLYGGGLGDATHEADVWGPVSVTLHGGTVTGSVFGCNNTKGQPQSTVSVVLDGSNTNSPLSVGNVFGGGNQANYSGSPTVTISGGKVISNVFGGGDEADILGNTSVAMSGGQVLGSIYGGGNQGSVGTYTGGGTTKPTACNASTGLSTVVVNGTAEVGRDNMKMTATGRPDDCGHVFGAGRGLVADTTQTKYRYLPFSAYVNVAHVTIGGTAFVKGSVYGGSENGHVLDSTYVRIQDQCQIGNGDGVNRRYTDEEWSTATSLEDCASWTYASDGGKPYDPYGFGGGLTTATDGHTFYGNVFGGGSGLYPYASGKWLRSAGRVEGNTRVEITGGHILTSVYGGNELTDVAGHCTVTMTGGTVGVPRTEAKMKAHPVTCYIFGAGKGDPREYFNVWTNVASTSVSISGTARIFGSVFGGGEDGHVLGNARTTISGSGVRIGTTGTSGADGNIFGGGRGFLATALTAGVVGGNVSVDISGGTFLGTVYGGGEAGNVTGNVAVNLYGGEVDSCLYGGGALAHTNTNEQTATKLAAQALTTQVNLHGGSVGKHVFGGGLGQKPNLTDPDANDVPAYVCGDVSVKLNETTATDNCVVKGFVHGCNNYNGTPLGAVNVHVYKTQGWDGHDRTAAKADDSVAKGSGIYELEGVYGGGNEANYDPTSATAKATVTIDGCELTSIRDVYGGGNAACVPAAQVTVNSCYEIDHVFGGGNGLQKRDDGSDNPGANVGYYTYEFDTATGTPRPGQTKRAYGTGIAQTDILGGTVHNVYGGSNTKGNVRTSATVKLDEEGSCPLVTDEVYGGGNAAYMEGGAGIVLGCILAMNELYGGAKNADIEGDVAFTITSGRFTNVFGGNNSGGRIKGTITVNIEETGCQPIEIDSLYGGGNQAAYTAPTGEHGPTINVRSATRIGTIFGGGKGDKAKVTGDTYINISMVKGQLNTNDSDASNDGALRQLGTIGNIYGGGNAADVDGDTYVNIGTLGSVTMESITIPANKTKTVDGVNIVGNVYGGGNAADVSGTTHVTVGS